LTTENRSLKVQQRRNERALAQYESKQNKQSQMIKLFKEDISTLKKEIRQMNKSYMEMESNYRLQANQLFVLRKQHTRLSGLSKDERQITAHELHDRLEVAYRIIEYQQSKIMVILNYMVYKHIICLSKCTFLF